MAKTHQVTPGLQAAGKAEKEERLCQPGSLAGSWSAFGSSSVCFLGELNTVKHQSSFGSEASNSVLMASCIQFKVNSCESVCFI